jgi:hypothetical protein
MDKEIGDCNAAQKTFRTDLDVLEDRMMDVEMSTSGAHRMIAEVRDFSDSFHWGQRGSYLAGTL